MPRQKLPISTLDRSKKSSSSLYTCTLYLARTQKVDTPYICLLDYISIYLSILEEAAFRTVEAVEVSHAHLVVMVQVLLAHQHVHLNWEEDQQLQVFHIVLILDSALVKRG